MGIANNLQNDILLLAVLMLVSAVLSGYVGLSLRTALVELNDSLTSVQQLKFTGRLTARGMSREVHTIQSSFHAMQDFLELFSKFVPSVVMERITSSDRETSFGSSILCLYRANCTVMVSVFENFFSIHHQCMSPVSSLSWSCAHSLSWSSLPSQEEWYRYSTAVTVL